jgi:ribosome assembly protein SQT1
MNVFSGHSGNVACGGFTPDGRSIVSGGDDGSLIIWDPKTAAVKAKIQASPESYFPAAPVTSLAFHPQSQLALVGSEDGASSLVHITNGKVREVLLRSRHCER